MQDPIRPINTAIPVQTYPLKARTAPPKTDEALDAKKRRSEQRQADQRQTESSSTDHENVTLHDLIPPELLTIPQVATGKSAALASYLANQGSLTPSDTAEENSERANLDIEGSNTINRQVVSEPDDRRGGIPAAGLPYRATLLLTGSNKASAVSSYRANNDEPVYVAVPDSVIAMSGQASKLKSLTQNISDNVKNAYYKLMTMVPYSVGMFLNVFA